MKLLNAVSLYQIALKFIILFVFKRFYKKFFVFVVILVNLYPIRISERPHPLACSANIEVAFAITSLLMFYFLNNMRFHKSFVSGQYLCSLFSSLSTFA